MMLNFFIISPNIFHLNLVLNTIINMLFLSIIVMELGKRSEITELYNFLDTNTFICLSLQF